MSKQSILERLHLVKPKRFMDKLLEGSALLTDIEAYVGAWHDSDSKEEIHEFLGMSQDEYALWVEKPQALRYIAFSRQHHVNLGEALELADGVAFAARSQSQDDARLIKDWLKKTNRL